MTNSKITGKSKNFFQIKKNKKKRGQKKICRFSGEEDQKIKPKDSYNMFYHSD